MEAIGRDRGINGTGWQARGVPELFKAELWQEISLDKVLEKALRRRGAPGEFNGEETSRSAWSTPLICQEDRDGTRDALPVKRRPVGNVASDRYARPHHGARALSAVQIRFRAQKPPAPPWAETTAMATGNAPTPDGRTKVISRCVLGFIHPRSGGITATTSSTTTGWTGARYKEPLT